MDAQTLSIIDKLTTVAILFLLLQKETARTDKLFAQITDQAKEHANNIMKLVSMGIDRRQTKEDVPKDPK